MALTVKVFEIINIFKYPAKFKMVATAIIQLAIELQLQKFAMTQVMET